MVSELNEPLTCISGPKGTEFSMHTADVKLLESPFTPYLLSGLSGGLTCLELSSEYLFTSITPISEEGKNKNVISLFHVIQEHSIIWEF